MNIEKEWKSEPDFVEEIDEESGYKYFIIRSDELKILTAYVKINKDHPLFLKDENNSIVGKLEVHGGISWSGNGGAQLGKLPRNEEYWYFGFDAGHAYDIAPGILETLQKIRNNKLEDNIIGNSTYKNIEFMRNECKKLAKQLKKYEINHG